MVGNHAHGNVRLRVFAIDRACHGSNHTDDGLEHVRVIVGCFPLQGHAEAFEAHAGIDDAGREGFEASVSLAVILHEDEVPDFDDLRMVVVHQVTSGNFGTFFSRTEVNMDFRAGTTGTRVAHFPEVVVLVAVEDVVFREELFPVAGSFIVPFQSFLGASFEDRGIEVGRVDFQHVYQVFPCPADGLLLEIISERPVAQHLEHRMVVGVVSHFFQVVVLAAHAQTLLGVSHTFVLGGVVAKDYVFELVHSGIGKHQGRVIFDHHGSRRYDDVAF